MDIGVFQENKFMNGIYTRELDGYRVVVTSSSNRHCGKVALFYQESPKFAVEAMHQFGANFIMCQLATGEQRWYIFGYYLALGDG